MTRTLLNPLLFACLAFVLEWACITNTSLIPTGKYVLGDLKSIIKSTSNTHNFIHTIDISRVATAIVTVKHTTTSAPLDALKSLLLYYVPFTYSLRMYYHMCTRRLCSCIRMFARNVVKVCFPSTVMMITNVSFTEHSPHCSYSPSWTVQGPTPTVQSMTRH